MLVTQLLIDGSDLPPAIRVEKTEKKDYVTQGRAGQTPRTFKFVKTLTQKVEGEEDRVVYLYRLQGMSDADFEAVAFVQGDFYLNPEKYAKVQSKPLNADERTELEKYRAKFGAL